MILQTESLTGACFSLLVAVRFAENIHTAITIRTSSEGTSSKNEASKSGGRVLIHKIFGVRVVKSIARAVT